MDSNKILSVIRKALDEAGFETTPTMYEVKDFLPVIGLIEDNKLAGKVIINIFTEEELKK